MKRVDTVAMLDILSQSCTTGTEERHFLDEVFEWVENNGRQVDELRDEIASLTKRAESAESRVEDLESEVADLKQQIEGGEG